MKNSVNNDYPVLKGRLLATLVLLLCVMMIGTAVAQSFGVVTPSGGDGFFTGHIAHGLTSSCQPMAGQLFARHLGRNHRKPE